MQPRGQASTEGFALDPTGKVLVPHGVQAELSEPGEGKAASGRAQGPVAPSELMACQWADRLRSPPHRHAP